MKTNEQLFAIYAETNDQTIFAELFDRFHAPLLTYLRRFFGDDTTAAEDTIQQVWLKVSRHPDQFEPGGKLANWLHKATYTTAIDVLRSNAQHKAELVFGRLEAQPDALLERVHAAVDTLAPSDRKLVVLMFHKNRSYEQAASEIGCTVNECRVKLFRALKFIRTKLAA